MAQTLTPAPALARHHIAALIFTVPLIVILAIDWVITGVTGRRTFITDDAVAGPGGVSTAIGITSSLGFAAIAFVLIREAPRFSGLGRLGRVCRWSMIGGTIALAIGQTIIYRVVKALDVTGFWLTVSDLAAATAIGLTFVPALLLGLLQIRQNRLGIGGRLLMLTVPALLVTIAIALVDQDWASPVLLTMSLLGGLSLVGAGRQAGDSR